MALAAVLALLLGAAPVDARGLMTGITDPLDSAFAERDGLGSYHVAHVAGARVVRVPVVWAHVAGAAPASASDPDDPEYRWLLVDDRIKRILANGLQPIVSVTGTPRWARQEGRERTPNAGDLAAFMQAIARRYDGRAGRPRVRYFQVWNEPNLTSFMEPDPGAYRAMLRASDPAVHAVRRSNVVVAGGLGPFGGRYGMAPKVFMRRLFARRAPFDVWSMHPYTSGAPAHEAYRSDDVSLGDLPEVRRMLDRAKRAGRIRSTRFWVTEFSWDTKPPDPGGVPAKEHARWVSEALFRMWRSGVDTVVWFQLRDNPSDGFAWGQTFQSGLYYRTTPLYADERPKPAVRAFRFPFVALPAGSGRVRVWGRTPQSEPNPVVIEQRAGGRWRTVMRVRARRSGIFTRLVRQRSGATYRARADGDRSAAFVARRTRDRRVNPFGGKDGLSLGEGRR